MKRYAEYKDSGAEWIGEIPEHYQIVPLFSVVSENRVKNSSNTCANLLSLSYGKIVNKDINTNDGLLPESFETYQVVEKGYTILRLTDLQNDKRSLRSGYVGETGIITSAYVGLVPSDRIDGRFLANLMHGYDVMKIFYSLGNGVRQSMNYADLKWLPVVLPPLSTQKAIADYLERKIAGIDTLMADKQKLIELLHENRNAVISEAVTKGLDPTIPMKDSQIDWVGKIPAHWTVTRIKNLFFVVDERNADDSAMLLSLFTAIGVKPRSEMEERGNRAVTVMNYKRVVCGDLIVNKLLAWMGAIAYSEYDGVTSPDYDVYRAKSTINVVKDYYHHYFRNTNFKSDCYKYGHGIMMMRWRTYPEEFLSIPVLNPPFAEQVKIAEYVRNESEKIDALISDITEQIEKLKEYRQSVISEVVTGKVSV